MGQNAYTQAQLSFSKSCLFDALVDLLEEKDLYQIGITELTEKAGVSRTTFYRNYNQISDIIVEFLHERPMGWTTDITPDKYSAYDVTAGYFDYLIANKKFFQTLYKRNLLHYLLETTH